MDGGRLSRASASDDGRIGWGKSRCSCSASTTGDTQRPVFKLLHGAGRTRYIGLPGRSKQGMVMATGELGLKVFPVNRGISVK